MSPETTAKEVDTDIVHKFGGHIDWNESFYFNAYDREKDICVFMRIGLKPNRMEKNMYCYILLPDGSTVWAKEVGAFDGPDLKSSGLTLRKIVPNREWLLLYSGAMRKTAGSVVESKNVSISLKWTGVNEVYDYALSRTEGREAFSLMAATEHLEQFGRVEGEIVLDGTKTTISGLGERDHSWGVGDWIAPTIWTWLSCQASDRFAFNITKLIVDQQVVDAGFVYNDGVNEPVVRAEVVTEYAPSGGPKNLKAWLTTRKGKVYMIEGDALKTARLPFTSGFERMPAIMFETLTRFKCENEMGYGIAEYLIRLR